jgi:hypothetical protein
MKIITAVVNNPDFIEMQYYTLKKYFKGEYEFIVFNDAKGFPDFTNDNDVTIKSQIQEICSKLKIECINIPNENHQIIQQASERTANSLNFILTYQKNNPDKYLLLDSDMFLIDYFDIGKYDGYHCAIVLQSRNDFQTNYFWNGIYYFDMFKLKNVEAMNWDCCQGCDTGGMMQEWLTRQMEGCSMPNTDEIRWTNKIFHTKNIYFIKHLWSLTWDLTELPEKITDTNIIDFLKNDKRNQNGKFFCEIYDKTFLHYRAGGNWMGEGMKFHKELTDRLKNCLLG